MEWLWWLGKWNKPTSTFTFSSTIFVMSVKPIIFSKCFQLSLHTKIFILLNLSKLSMFLSNWPTLTRKRGKFCAVILSFCWRGKIKFLIRQQRIRCFLMKFFIVFSFYWSSFTPKTWKIIKGRGKVTLAVLKKNENVTRTQVHLVSGVMIKLNCK